ncbi:uncharacterized protein B0I36DRAFT_337369 [Microdochium trichocladiopsis]|uniref:PD-(D/E)XK nuclease-like domain-containing protein n=1 Tax=Microdochium trichocladiopsis TaxID=1682393 RepID=A0A9P8XT91_9PEZI|nr:uncharacterized protein B0I36DRAFT_337369 [Microdochium trichocladiopsis]KAH7016336.1 hypothetical protein B0I36DRAFT_337369 [Microdochium trichocladiopsis]
MSEFAIAAWISETTRTRSRESSDSLDSCDSTNSDTRSAKRRKGNGTLREDGKVDVTGTLPSPTSSMAGDEARTPRKRSAVESPGSGVEEEEPTPRGKVSSAATVSAPTQLPPSSWATALSLQQRDYPAAGAATPSSSSASRPSKRSRSPTKSTADLRSANIEVRDFYKHSTPLHASADALLADLKKVAAGLKVVPAIIANAAAREGGNPTHSFYEHQVNKDKYCLSDELAIDEFRQLHRILASAASCREEAQSEAAWNALVHSPLLHHAVESSQCPQVTPFIATTAGIIPALLPRNIYTGHAVGGRLVDFCITIDVDRDAVTDLLATQSEALCSLNQTLYTPLRQRPIAIVAETKTETAPETGENQLAIWTKAWLNRLRMFGNANLTDVPPLPLLRIKGHEWYLLLAWEEAPSPRTDGDDENEFAQLGARKEPKLVLLGDLHIGSTRSILTVYQLVNALRHLTRWADGPFREWYQYSVLGRNSQAPG